MKGENEKNSNRPDKTAPQKSPPAAARRPAADTENPKARCAAMERGSRRATDPAGPLPLRGRDPTSIPNPSGACGPGVDPQPRRAGPINQQRRAPQVRRPMTSPSGRAPRTPSACREPPRKFILGVGVVKSQRRATAHSIAGPYSFPAGSGNAPGLQGEKDGKAARLAPSDPGMTPDNSALRADCRCPTQGLAPPRAPRRSLAIAHSRGPKSHQHRQLKAASSRTLPNLLPHSSPQTLTPLPHAGSSTPADRERMRGQPAPAIKQRGSGHRYKHHSTGAPRSPRGGQAAAAAERAQRPRGNTPCAAAAARQGRQRARTRSLAAGPALSRRLHAPASSTCARHQCLRNVLMRTALGRSAQTGAAAELLGGAQPQSCSTYEIKVAQALAPDRRRTRRNISSIASMPSLLTSTPGCACSAPPLGKPSACWLPACHRTQEASASELGGTCERIACSLNNGH